MGAYRTLAAQTIAQYGGRYLAQGDAAEVVEGGPPAKTIIIVEFPSMARARMVRIGRTCRCTEASADGARAATAIRGGCQLT
jgi:uncharacterized protein (DUF1330 family)